MCDTMVRLGDDGVLFAKNSDRDPNESQLLEWRAAADHAEGSFVECTSLAIPQVAHTHAVLLSRPWWMWGAEIGANERGVVIGNEAVFTDQAYEDTGLLGMDLLRLALERADDAAAAVEVIVTLLERHGQGGSCSRVHPKFTYHNSFIVADPSTAIVVETAGRRWATEEVAPGAARSISNGLTIAGFADEHADRLRGRVASCAARRSITEAGAVRAVGPLDLMGTLRSHGASTHPSYSPLNGALGAPCAHAGGLLTSTQTTASWVADLRDGASGLHWVTGTAAPCTSLFAPARVDEPVDLGPSPSDVFDESTRWWRHERLHRLVDRDPATTLPRYPAERDAVEAAWVADPPAGAEAWATSDELEARWLADVEASRLRDRRPPLVRRLWRGLDRDARMPS